MRQKRLRKIEVLIIDDEPYNLEVLGDQLIYHGANVTAATSAQEALQLLTTSNYTPQVILSDIHMPNMDGYQLLTFLHLNPKTAKLPVLAITANALSGARENALAHGFNAFMSKPFDMEELVTTVLGLLPKPESTGKTGPLPPLYSAQPNLALALANTITPSPVPEPTIPPSPEPKRDFAKPERPLLLLPATTGATSTPPPISTDAGPNTNAGEITHP